MKTRHGQRKARISGTRHRALMDAVSDVIKAGLTGVGRILFDFTAAQPADTRVGLAVFFDTPAL